MWPLFDCVYHLKQYLASILLNQYIFADILCYKVTFYAIFSLYDEICLL